VRLDTHAPAWWLIADPALPKAEHADPFDRMLAARARIEHLRLVTGDRALAPLAPAVLW
jgi:PIN domain nuclease of toxin-antitoxin system